MASITAGALFLRFWRRTGDVLYLALGAAFIIEGLNRTSLLFFESPNIGHISIYIVRILAFLLIPAAMIYKSMAAARFRAGGFGRHFKTVAPATQRKSSLT